MLIKRLFLTAFTVVISAAVINLVGGHDLLALAVLLGVSLMMIRLVVEFHIGGRRILANHLNKTGRISQFLSKPGFFTYLTAFIFSLSIASTWMISIKLLSLSHGFPVLLAMIGCVAFFVFPMVMPAESIIGEKRTLFGLAKTELASSTYDYASMVSALIIVVVIFNLIFSLMLSMKDLYDFINLDVGMHNFDLVALEKSIKYNQYNEYSRIMLNSIILASITKVAVVQEIWQGFFPEIKKSDGWVALYIVTFMLNFVKLVPFSLGLVMIMRVSRIKFHYAKVWVDKISQNNQDVN